MLVRQLGARSAASGSIGRGETGARRPFPNSRNHPEFPVLV